MEEEGVTNYRLAKAIYVTEGTIRAWRTGTKPKGKNLERLSNYFNRHPGWFLFGDVKRPPVFLKDVEELSKRIDLYVRKHPKSFRKIKQAVELIIEEN